MATQIPVFKKADLTSWFPGSIRPRREGMYRVQDHTMRCSCCWMEFHWDGVDWHSDLFSPGVFRTLVFPHQVKRWRGLNFKFKA